MRIAEWYNFVTSTLSSLLGWAKVKYIDSDKIDTHPQLSPDEVFEFLSKIGFHIKGYK